MKTTHKWSVWAIGLLTTNHTWKWNYTQVVVWAVNLQTPNHTWKWNYTQVVVWAVNLQTPNHTWKWNYTQVVVWAVNLQTPDHTWNWNYTQVICVGNRLTDAQNFVSPFLIYSDNSINSPNGGLVIIIRLQNFATKWLLISCGRECLFTYRRCFE